MCSKKVCQFPIWLLKNYLACIKYYQLVEIWQKKRDWKRKDFWPIFFQFCCESVPNLEGIKVKNHSSRQIQESKKKLLKCTNHNRNICFESLFHFIMDTLFIFLTARIHCDIITFWIFELRCNKDFSFITEIHNSVIYGF